MCDMYKELHGGQWNKLGVESLEMRLSLAVGQFVDHVEFCRS